MPINLILKFSIIILLYSPVFSQNYENEKDYFQWFDKLTDTQNSHLSNGTSYFEEYDTKKGHHQYYLTSDFLTGDLIYDGQPYFNVNLQYNLFTDQLILRFYKGENLRTIQLIKDKVEKFSINNSEFISIPEKESGFYEILFKKGQTRLYKKHYKTRQRHLDKALVYYSFKEKNSYLLYHNKKYFAVNKRKSITRIFPEKKELINTYFNRRSNLYALDKDKFMTSLLQQIADD